MNSKIHNIQFCNTITRLAIVALIISFIYINNINAQSVINSASGNGTSGQVELNWSLGETFIQTTSSESSNIVLTEGFHQPSIKIATGIENQLPEFLNNLKIYPNPATEYITLDFSELEKDKEYSLKIIDVNGKLIKTETLYPGQLNTVQIHVKNYSAGLYKLIISNNKSHGSYSLIIE